MENRATIMEEEQNSNYEYSLYEDYAQSANTLFHFMKKERILK